MKVPLSSQSAPVRAGDTSMAQLRKQVDELLHLVRDLQHTNRALTRENTALRGQGEPTQTRPARTAVPADKSPDVRPSGQDALSLRHARKDALERSGVHDMQRLGLGKHGATGPLRAVAEAAQKVPHRRPSVRLTPHPMPAAQATPLAATSPHPTREPSLFVGGSIDIGIIPDVLRAQFANSWATPLMSISAQALDTIWGSDQGHDDYRRFVRDLCFVRQVPLHWRDRQSMLPPPAHAAKRTGLQAALARAEAARPSDNTSTFVTRQEAYAFASAAAGLALLSLSRGDVQNFARILGAAPKTLLPELFAQSPGAHVFDQRNTWATLAHLTSQLDISHEHFLAHKELVDKVVTDFLAQHLDPTQTPRTQLFLQRAWPVAQEDAKALGGLKQRYIGVIDALVAQAESQSNVYSTLAQFDDKRFAMQQHGIVFALMLDGLEQQMSRLSSALSQGPHPALAHLDVSIDDLRYQVRQRLSILVRRAQEGFFVPGEPRLSKEQMGHLPERLRAARQQLGHAFVKQIEQWRK